jgi:hypothetical protein
VESLSVRCDQQQSINRIADQMAKLHADVKAVQDSLQDVANLPKETKLAVQLRQIERTVTDIQTRPEKLEQAILTSPSKALEIPLLQRDLENLKVAQQAPASFPHDPRYTEIAFRLIGSRH